MPEHTRILGEVAALLSRARRVLITSHTSPDGDAIGSELGAAELVRQWGGEATIINRDPAPENLAFLPGAGDILVRDALGRDLGSRFDLALVLECPDIDRTGFDRLTDLTILNIDHHTGNSSYGQLNLIDEQAAAVCELLVAVADAGGATVTTSMATCFYAALVTDTGDFRYSNTTSRALQTAARLVAAGAQPQAIAEALWCQVPERQVRLTASVLATLRRYHEGRIAVIHCDRGMLDAAGAFPEDTENLLNPIRAMAGVEVAVMLKRFSEDVRVSLRSRGTVDVQAVAVQLHGGGHHNAAGCTLVSTSLPDAERTVLAALERSLAGTPRTFRGTL